MRQPLVAGNWKMHGTGEGSVALADAVVSGASGLNGVQVAVIPPAVFIPLVARRLQGSGVALGAQNVCDREQGANTGEISAAMLHEFGCAYALTGHSERRSLYGETDELVAARTAAALQHGGITPIVCIGETLQEREGNQASDVIARQFHAIAGRVGADGLAKLVIAYEPVWAIGTGLTASPEQAQEVHAQLRDLLREQRADLADTVRIIYGGSVKPDNAETLFAMPDIDGGLIGGASLKADDFLAICRAAEAVGKR